jgi:hypothetical protein
MDRHEEEPFRFLDLPKEVRLMVYEFIPVEVRDVKLRMKVDRNNLKFIFVIEENEPSLTMSLYKTSTQILRVCHEVRDEAHAIMKRKLEQIEQVPPNATLFMDTVAYMIPWEILLEAVTHWTQALLENSHKDFHEWWVAHYLSNVFRWENFHWIETPQSMLDSIQQMGVQLRRQRQQLKSIYWYQRQAFGEFITVVFAIRAKYRTIPPKRPGETNDSWSARKLNCISRLMNNDNWTQNLPESWLMCEMKHRLSSKRETPLGEWSSDHLMIWNFRITAEERDKVVQMSDKGELWKLGGFAEE